MFFSESENWKKTFEFLKPKHSLVEYLSSSIVASTSVGCWEGFLCVNLPVSSSDICDQFRCADIPALHSALPPYHSVTTIMELITQIAAKTSDYVFLGTCPPHHRAGSDRSVLQHARLGHGACYQGINTVITRKIQPLKHVQ